MAAVTNNLETDEPSEVEADRGSVAGLGGAATNAKSLGLAHAQLTKTVWLRVLLERELQKRSYKLLKRGSDYVFVVDPSFESSAIKWSPFPSNDYCTFSLLSEHNQKMDCPSFSLPAGGLLTGGSCPGADAAQTVTPVDQRVARMDGASGQWRLRVATPGGTEPARVREGATICSRCYATGGNFIYANIHTAEVLRYWWLRKKLADGQMDWLVGIFVDAFSGLHMPLGRQGIRPFRLHDSGDFFSYDYAEMWCRVADVLATQMPDVVIWAPTRTWAQGGWQEFWARRLPQLRSLQTTGRANLMVRASGYNFGDFAPGALHPSNAKGSTSLFKPQAKVPDDMKNRTDPLRVGHAAQHGETRVDWNCQVYGAEKASCTLAMAPDGKMGCRACWVHPELSVNYSAH